MTPDAYELRIDHLKDLSASSVISYVHWAHSSTIKPLIFTVRSKAEGGSFDGSDAEYEQLVSLGIKLKCAAVDIEICRASPKLVALARFASPHTLTIGSFHDVARSVNWDADKMNAMVRRADWCDIVKLIGVADDDSDNLALR